MSVNKVILVGRLGKDPEVRHLDNGAVVATFSLATDDSYKNKDGQKVEQTDWHNLVIWRKQAEIAEKYLSKGSLIYVEGKLKTRSYEQDNVKKYVTEVVVDNFRMLGSKSDNNNQSAAQGTPSSSSTSTTQSIEVNDEADDDLPF